MARLPIRHTAVSIKVNTPGIAATPVHDGAATPVYVTTATPVYVTTATPVYVTNATPVHDVAATPVSIQFNSVLFI